MEPERTWSNVTFAEIERIVDDAHHSDYLDRQAAQRQWAEAQRTKAPVILDLLRQHLPAGG